MLSVYIDPTLVDNNEYRLISNYCVIHEKEDHLKAYTSFLRINYVFSSLLCPSTDGPLITGNACNTTCVI